MTECSLRSLRDQFSVFSAGWDAPSDYRQLTTEAEGRSVLCLLSSDIRLRNRWASLRSPQPIPPMGTARRARSEIRKQEPRNTDTRENLCIRFTFASFAPFAVEIGFYLIPAILFRHSCAYGIVGR
jgi:hypothetical protein